MLTGDSRASQSDQTDPRLCFHTFIKSLAAGVECTISKVADPGLGAAVGSLKGPSALQQDLKGFGAVPVQSS